MSVNGFPLREDEEVWIPPKLRIIRDDGLPRPPEPFTVRHQDNTTFVNTVPDEVVPASLEVMEEEIRRHGRKGEGHDIPRDLGQFGEIRAHGYMDYHWTHFDYRLDVAKHIVRIQKLFPWLTFANTYFEHPPVYRRKFEFVSYDLWAGGLDRLGNYLGYRGKNIWLTVDGWEVFNAIFNDPYLPNIAWIIFDGYMWTAGYGWGPAPAGPPDSDPKHRYHIHSSMALWPIG